MNKMLPPDHARLSDKAVLRLMGVSLPHPGAAFNKRPEGRARRLERRQAIARKMDWLNS
jgi:hypothetical protein